MGTPVMSPAAGLSMAASRQNRQLCTKSCKMFTGRTYCPGVNTLLDQLVQMTSGCIYRGMSKQYDYMITAIYGLGSDVSRSGNGTS